MAPGGEKAVLGRGSSSGTACVSKKKGDDYFKNDQWVLNQNKFASQTILINWKGIGWDSIKQFKKLALKNSYLNYFLDLVKSINNNIN